MHASRLGSHGARLAPHYAAVLRSGRVNGRPRLTTHDAGGAGLVLDADDGIGHLAAYEAMRLACERAGSFGIGAAGVRRSSHFGVAGAYALAAAEAGFVGICSSNADFIVALHGGTQPFYGTNPIAAAVPLRGSRPWLLDMATSSVPLNRVHLYATHGLALPESVATDAEGRPTTEAAIARSLLPLGGTASWAWVPRPRCSSSSATTPSAYAALYRLVIVRMRTHQPTIDYVRRRTAEGKSKPEIIRCLKRYVAREIFAYLCRPAPPLQAATANP
ncbi:Ldh family oxidoreductase [Roseomonas sp. GCM10028921]